MQRARLLIRAGTLPFWLLGATLLAAPTVNAASAPHYSKRAAIHKLTMTLASDLDKTLPRERFAHWLRDITGVSDINWSVQVGCGDPNNSTPNDVCVSSVVPIADDVNIGLFFRVGTIEHFAKKPSIVLLFHERSDQSHYEEIPTLHDLAAFVNAIVPRTR